MIQILDKQSDKIVAVLKDELFSAKHTRTGDLEETLNFSLSVTNPKVEFLTSRNRIIIQDEDRGYREFIISLIEKDDETVDITCTSSFLDLQKTHKVIASQSLTGQTPKSATAFVLNESEWKVGDIEFANIQKVTFSFDSDRSGSPYEALKIIASTFDKKIKFRIEIEGNEITGRYVDMATRIGQFRGKEIEFAKDLSGISRDEQSSEIVTALSCETPPKEDGTRITTIVEDKDALRRWGRNGKHLMETYTPESSDEDMTISRLKTLGQNELQKRINASVEYTIEQVDLEKLKGYEHEKVRFGDTVRIKDLHYVPPLYMEADVVELERDLIDPSERIYKLGQFIEYNQRDILKEFDEFKRTATKIIKSPTPPKGSSNTVWINTSGNIDIMYTWDGTAWRKATPTQASEIGAETPEGAQEKADAVRDEVIEYTDYEISKIKDNIIYKIETFSTMGSMFKNGVIDTEVVAFVYKGKENVTTSLPTSAYSWKKFLTDGTEDSTWIGTGIGRVVPITEEEVDGRATFQCDVTIDGALVGSSQTTLINLNDAVISDVRPENPTKGQWYVNKSTMPPILEVFNGTQWEKQQLALGELDPALMTTIGDLQGEVEAIDNRVTTSESTIEQLSDSIKSKVESITFDDLKENVDIQKSILEQQAGEISSKVSKNNVISEINQTPEQIKITADKFDVHGMATFFASGNPNLMPPRMDSFEQIEYGTLPSTMFVGSTSLIQKSISNYNKYEGTRSIVLEANKNDDGWLYLAPTSTTYNIPVQMGATYIFSFYSYNPDSTKTASVSGAVRLSDSTFIRGGVKLLSQDEGWFRYEIKFTVPTGISSLNTLIYNNATNIPVYFDCFQFERVEPNVIKASPWRATATTIIDGGNITTNSIVASHIRSLNGLDIGQLSIDSQGNLKIKDGAVLESVAIKSSTLEGITSSRINLGSNGGWIDYTKPNSTLNRTRFGTNGATYLAIDDVPAFFFVLDSSFSCSLTTYDNGYNYGLKLGHGILKGLSTLDAMQIRNANDTDYGDLTVRNLTLTGGLKTLNGDAEIVSSGSILRLVGSQHGFIEFFPFGKAQGRKGWLGYGTAGDTTLTVKANSALRLESGAARIDLDNASSAVYIKSSSGGDATAYAKTFTPTSRREIKKNIEPFTGADSPDGTFKTALQQINDTPISKYHFNEEFDYERKHVGIVMDTAPCDIVDIRGNGIDLYAMNTYGWAAIQELSKELVERDNKINELETRISNLESLVL
ncbi:phage tail spike protein [Priestia megaterium]|uniref:phage tail spike protein n=1 Tax=Priestia megaterium TaxID=1404 RepID=UPI000BFB9A7E|nr:phage tail spike protein [Priestia megaterium]PGR01355.1 hypothetical protein COA23_23175 [Priestia megaterium]